jgi:hypothetical protein
MGPSENVCYSHYWFQNQREAHWAVFFDRLGVAWEHPGTQLAVPLHNHYLPEFWLPVQQCWLAVRTAQPDEKELLQAADLAFSIHKWVAVVWGNIGEHHIYAFYPPFYEQGYYKRYVFSLCDHCHQLILACPVRGGKPDELMGYCHNCQDMVLQTTDIFISHPRLLFAYSVARQARFAPVEMV